ncbi:MAG: hypothetical protein V3U88_12430 [Methylococcales bacterium]
MSLNIQALVVLTLLISPMLSSASKSVNYIYIDASEGNASGGHVAMHFNDDVYHYQYVEPGLIKLEKQAVNDFEFTYRFLENRSLFLSQLAVSDQSYALLRDHFDFLYQIQQQHYAVSTELDREQLLLQFFSGQPVTNPQLLQLPAAGLFYGEQDFSEGTKISAAANIDADRRIHQEVLTRLHKKIENQYGKDVIEQRLQDVVKRIEQMQPTVWTKQSIQLQADRFPAITYTFANRYLDSMTAWMALKVIQDQRPLRMDAFRSSDAADFVLTPAQQNALQRFSVSLQDNILHLLQSSRPDWGYALLINMARLLVVEQSIQQQRLVLLDSFDIDSVTDDIHQPRYQDELHILYHDTLKNLRQVQQQLVAQKQRQEVVYSQLEWLGNRFLELDKAIHDQVAVRWNGVKRVPGKPLVLPRLLIPQLTELQLQRSLKNMQQVAKRYQRELAGLYRYHLLQRNCVTELFATINEAVVGGLSSEIVEQLDHQTVQQSIAQLGGYVSMQSLNFIPFISNHAVHNQYQITEQRLLPSYRLQQLERLYAEENDLNVFFRESNAVSSTLYKANPSDSFFVFFTDQNVLLRPLYGAVNSLAGLGQSVLGLFSWPFDSGQRLQSGASGLIMSLPELVFFNMRKGSFKYVPYSKLLTANETIVRKPPQSVRLKAL